MGRHRAGAGGGGGGSCEGGSVDSVPDGVLLVPFLVPWL